MSSKNPASQPWYVRANALWMKGALLKTHLGVFAAGLLLGACASDPDQVDRVLTLAERIVEALLKLV